MLVVETIAKIRRAYFSPGKPIKESCRELHLSRAFARTHLYPRCFDRIVSLGSVAIEAEANERGEPRLPFELGRASRIHGSSVSRRLTVLA
jgi:hypothetical protein